MIILEDEQFICRYKYDNDDEELTMESSSKRYLEKKICELTDCGKGITYKIYAVVLEGYEEPPRDSE
jgi:hypothetical protein